MANPDKNRLFAEALKQKLPNIVTQAMDLNGYPAIIVKKEGIKHLALTLKDNSEYEFNVLDRKSTRLNSSHRL